MTISGFQDFWAVGFRFYFKKTGTDTPWVDFGVIQSATPNFAPQKIELFDTDGGVKKSVASAVSQLEESYDLVVSNLNLRNLSLAMLGSDLVAYSQSAGDKTAIPHRAIPENLMKIDLGDTAKTNAYDLAAVSGIVKASGGVTNETVALNSINKAAGTMTFASAPTVLSAGDRFFLPATGLTNKANAQTYEVLSIATAVVTLTVESAARVVADETGLTTIVKVEDTTDDLYLPGVDYEINSLARGWIRWLPGGALSAATDVEVYYYANVISGKRIFNPLAGSETKGAGLLFLGRDSNAAQNVRQIPSLSITPSGFSLTTDDYSNMTLTAKVLNDVASASSAGSMLHFLGAVPTES